MALPTRLIRTCVKRRPSPRPGGSCGPISTLNAKFLVSRQRLKRAAHGLSNILNAVIGKFEHQLAGLDLGQIEHVIDQSEQMLAVGLKAFENA